jgi:hypothetical protein
LSRQKYIFFLCAEHRKKVLLAMMMMIKKRNEIRGSELLNGDEKAD